MEQNVDAIFAAVGGPTKIARLLNAPVTTVFAWKKAKRIPPSRLAHLRLAAEAEGLEIPALDAAA